MERPKFLGHRLKTKIVILEHYHVIYDILNILYREVAEVVCIHDQLRLIWTQHLLR